jgi:acyl-CoA synthetase (AMP-forming)/AMP-acid ligase II
MADSYLLPDLIANSAARFPDNIALTYGKESLSYAGLQGAVQGFVNGVTGLGLQRGERIAIYLEKRFETVIASFGAPAAGGVFVPLNPLLKPEQVAYIMRDCNVRMLVTSPERYALLTEILAACHDLRHVVLLNHDASKATAGTLTMIGWQELLAMPEGKGHRVIDTDMTAILYTSGSTGKPKGVVLSHRNMVAGAKSVASYLENTSDDTLLAALPLSFDAGFSQLTTAFHVGARVVLLNYLLPRDVLKALEKERVTGLTAVPPLYIQLAQLDWPASITEHLRYFANTGGRMPRETLAALRARMPKTKPFLMYGLTEAFRSTFLPPSGGGGGVGGIGGGEGGGGEEGRVQGHPQRRNPRSARGRFALRAQRTGRTRPSRRAGRHGLLERSREDRRTLQAAARPRARPRTGPGHPGTRRFLR